MHGFIIFFSILFLSSIAINSNGEYLLPITKHEPTKRFYTTLYIGDPSKTPINLLLDLQTNLTWLDCHKLKSLTSQHMAVCNTTSCIPGNFCMDKLCLFQQPNPLGPNPNNQNVTCRVVQDTVFFSNADGSVGLRPFAYSCADHGEVEGFLTPPGVSGVLSLSPGDLSLTKQTYSGLSVVPKFAICLPSSSSSSGGAGRFYVAADDYFIGNSSDRLPMTYTPMRYGRGDYLVTVQALYVDEIPLLLNPNLLLGGVDVKLSTLVPYTILHTDLYNALSLSFTLKAKAMGISKVSPVEPFKDCFDARTAAAAGKLPVIEIGMPGRTLEVKWRFDGANTVVKVTDMVMCFAFFDGGNDPNKEVIVLGTHQLQDYMLEFNFITNAFSFSDPLSLHDTSCLTTS
ncbi:unnamed protein product [Cochlearia groenlandica]